MVVWYWCAVDFSVNCINGAKHWFNIAIKDGCVYSLEFFFQHFLYSVVILFFCGATTNNFPSPFVDCFQFTWVSRTVICMCLHIQIEITSNSITAYECSWCTINHSFPLFLYIYFLLLFGFIPRHPYLCEECFSLISKIFAFQPKRSLAFPKFKNENTRKWN